MPSMAQQCCFREPVRLRRDPGSSAEGHDLSLTAAEVAPFKTQRNLESIGASRPARVCEEKAQARENTD